MKKKKDFPGVPSAGSCPGGTCLPHTHGPAAESTDSDASALTTTNELGSTRRRTNWAPHDDEHHPQKPASLLTARPHADIHTKLNPACPHASSQKLSSTNSFNSIPTLVSFSFTHGPFTSDSRHVRSPPRTALFSRRALPLGVAFSLSANRARGHALH